VSRGGDQTIPRPSTVEAGAPAPWADLDAALRSPGLDHIRQVVVGAGPGAPSPAERAGIRPSAVLAPLYVDGGAVHVVLTRRADHLRSHRGEVSFPGGGHEEGDESLVHTSLREAEEEVGLDPASVDVVGELDHLTTVSSNSFIVPYVGILAGVPELTADPAEVAHIIEVSLDELLAPDVYHRERWDFRGAMRDMHFFTLERDTVWGATAAMLYNLLTLTTGTYAAPDWHSAGKWFEGGPLRPGELS
jgi:8-oxo-dGTP pyrophosphatase MutT (NUDIX family)